MTARQALFSFRSRLARFLGPLGGICLTAACSGPSEMMPQPDLLPPPGTLALGTLDNNMSWLDLVNDQTVQLVPGAQGGFHVWVLYRTRGLAGRVQVLRTADRVPTDGSARQRVLTTSGFITIPSSDGWQSDPIPSFMCPTPIKISVLSAPVELTVRITSADDPSQTLAQSVVRLQEQCPPVGDPSHDFCLSICQG